MQKLFKISFDKHQTLKKNIIVCHLCSATLAPTYLKGTIGRPFPMGFFNSEVKSSVTNSELLTALFLSVVDVDQSI